MSIAIQSGVSRTASRKFERLTFPLMSQLYSIALMLTQNQSDAEDLVQRTYANASENFFRFKAGGSIQRWMVRILANVHFARLNQRGEQARVTSGGSSSVAGVSHRAGLQRSSPDLCADPITSAIDRLPAELRAVVLLKDLCSLRYEEIAKLLPCQKRTVVSRLSRGRRKLLGFLTEVKEKK